jgi:8-oxo-dGTP pyrophosphatase MutT (NUDIX family)
MSQPFRTRRFIPVAPGDRPRRSRSAVRIVVTDGERVLMFRDTDPGVPGISWWLTPGGGIDPGETEHQAAVRELAEETGLRVSPGQLLGPIMHRTVVHGFSDQILTQAESFFALRHPVFEVDVSGHTVDEQVTLKGHAWLEIAELDSQPIPVWPENLRALINLMSRPDRWPWSVGVMEESTLAADYR